MKPTPSEVPPTAGAKRPSLPPGAEQAKRSREVRLGLVMYGGVSLAVYINGVADQLHRAVRGRGIYRLIKLLTDSEVLVDVLSGSSAGGINGILLASALCNGKEFSGTANLWRENGDISALLRDPNSDLMDCNSLLDSEGYYQSKLEEAFSLLAHAELDRTEREDPSPVAELDLFVTGTDFYGRETYRYDDAGHPLYVKEHRNVFQLKHREGRKEPFHPWADSLGQRRPEPSGTAAAAEIEKPNMAALAKLARITSCFPGAFAPVLVTPPPDGEAESSPAAAVEARLALWGQISRPSTFVDGGVLDNKPFTTTLGAIFHRMADRPVRRFLLYVEPDPERAPAAKRGKQTDRTEIPNIVRTVADSVSSIPAYESIAGDLKAIAQHNDKIERFRRLSALADAPASGAATSARPPSVPPSSAASQIYWQARWVAFSESLLRLISHDELPTEAMAKRMEPLSRWSDWLKLGGSAQVTQQLLSRYDVQYQLRRAISITYLCEEKGLSTPDAACLKILNRQVQLLEIAQYHLQRIVGSGVQRLSRGDQALTPRALWDTIRGELDRAWTTVSLPASCDGIENLDLSDSSACDAVLSRADLSAFHRALGADDSAARAARPSSGLLERTAAFERALLQRAPYVFPHYERFAARDHTIFPLEVAAGLEEKDLVRTVRVSPIDARRGLSGKEDKVCGARLAHFSAFFKRSWRSNDILWGRLDAACQLVETLIDGERVADVLSRSRAPLLTELAAWREDLQSGRVLCHCPRALRLELAAWLGQLQDPATRPDALKRLHPGEPSERSVLELLVLAEQLETLHRDLPNVVADAVQEQYGWNQFRGARSLPAASPSGPPPGLPQVDGQGLFVAGDLDFSPINVELASRQFALQAVTALAQRGQGGEAAPGAALLGPLGSYFRFQYQMGRERIERDIPRIVLLELVGRALIVARNSLLNAFGPYADTIRSNLVYRLLLDYPLRLFAALTARLRRSPTSERDLTLAALAYTAVCLVLLVLSGQQVLWPDQHLSTTNVVLFVVAPLTMMTVVASLGSAKQHSMVLRVARGLFTFCGAALGLLGLLLLVQLFFPMGSRQCAGVGALLEPLCKENPEYFFLPKAIAVALPLLAGALLHHRLGRHHFFEQELRARLDDVPDARLNALGEQLLQHDWPPKRHVLLRHGGRRRALVRCAERTGQLETLRQMLRVESVKKP
ncbi:MAG TPA: patatin-like protein [Polyangiaceae bacterium]|nr:patatin-like protein [Polyangiaceae bacterium]